MLAAIPLCVCVSARPLLFHGWNLGVLECNELK